MKSASPAVVRYSASRLHFKKAIIEPLGMDDRFRIDTPDGSFEMSKADFYRDFANVAESDSYRIKGRYHSKNPPQKAYRYLVDSVQGEDIRPLATHAAKKNSNRRLTSAELTDLFAPLLKSVRERLHELAGEDKGLHFALRRKLFKELVYDERSKPMQRRALKQKKIAAQDGKCAICQQPLPSRGSVLDRHEAMKGYVFDNVRILCPACDTNEQEKKNYS